MGNAISPPCLRQMVRYYQQIEIGHRKGRHIGKALHDLCPGQALKLTGLDFSQPRIGDKGLIFQAVVPMFDKEHFKIRQAAITESRS